MDLVNIRERFDNLLELLGKSVSSKSDFSHVKCADTLNLEASTHNGWSFSLRAVKHDVKKLVGRRHNGDILPRQLHRLSLGTSL
jgi:hypothetical protein